MLAIMRSCFCLFVVVDTVDKCESISHLVISELKVRAEGVDLYRKSRRNVLS